MLEMVTPRRVVQEGVGRVNVELRRTGDSSKPLQVLCVTRYKNEQGRLGSEGRLSELFLIFINLLSAVVLILLRLGFR